MIELFQQEFVRNAFLAGTLVAVVSAVVGYFVVLRAQSFAAHALSHVGFAGATGAALIGLSSLVGMFGFTLLAALGMGALEKKIQGRDIEIGMILSFFLGLGVLFLRLYTSRANEAVGVLFGSILSVTNFDVMLTLIFGILTLAGIAVLFRPLLFSSIDPDVAEARGVPVKLISMVFMFFLAITVAEAVQVVGVLLVFALIVAPAATAQHVSKKPGLSILISVLFSLFFTWGGLFLAFSSKFPVSFYIAALSALTSFIVVNVSHRVAPHKIEEAKHPDREIVEENL